jgi:hypothetical protein
MAVLDSILNRAQRARDYLLGGARRAAAPAPAVATGAAAVIAIAPTLQTPTTPQTPTAPTAPRQPEAQRNPLAGLNRDYAEEADAGANWRPRPTTDSDTLQQIVQILIGSETPTNPLNKTEQVAYHFRLFSAGEADLYDQVTANGDSSGADIAALYQKIDDIDKVILAESGVTGYNIREVEIESIVAPDFTSRNTAATSFKMVISEALGTSFLDSLYIATAARGVRNYRLATFYLELRFLGYGEDGASKTNALADTDLKNGGRWIWPISILEIDTKFDHTGGVYSITALTRGSDIAISDTDGLVPEALSVSGDTLGEFLNAFGLALTNNARDRYLGDVVKYNFKLYTFTNPAGTPVDPSTFQMRPLDTERNPSQRTPMESSPERYVRGSIQPGCRISDVIEFAILSTEEARRLGFDRSSSPPTGTANESMASVNGRNRRETTVFRFEVDNKITGYDITYNRYCHEITYHIYPFYTQRPILTSEQLEGAANPQVQGQMVMALRERGLLERRYEYLFTGKNTEILDLDVRFKFNWHALLPPVDGTSATSASVISSSVMRNDNSNTNVNQTEPVQRVDLNRVAVENRQRATARQGQLDSIATLQREVVPLQRQLDAITGTLTAAQQEDKRRLISRITAIRSQIDAVSQSVGYLEEQIMQARVLLAEQAELRGLNLGAGRSGSVFVEDLVGTATSTQTDEGALGISMNHGGPFLNHVAGSGFAPTHNREMSVYGALLAQLQESVLLEINMTIRGDPFWLGTGGLMRVMDMRRGINPSSGNSGSPGSNSRFVGGRGEANYTIGENAFLLNFRYPYRLTDDNAASNFRSQDIFNGFYTARKVTHTFSGGVFKQSLNAVRLPMIDIAKLLGYSGVTRGGPATGRGDGEARQPNGQPATSVAATAANEAAATAARVAAETSARELASAPPETPVPETASPSSTPTPVPPAPVAIPAAPQPAPPPAPQPVPEPLTGLPPATNGYVPPTAQQRQAEWVSWPLNETSYRLNRRQQADRNYVAETLGIPTNQFGALLFTPGNNLAGAMMPDGSRRYLPGRSPEELRNQPGAAVSAPAPAPPPSPPDRPLQPLTELEADKIRERVADLNLDDPAVIRLIRQVESQSVNRRSAELNIAATLRRRSEQEAGVRAGLIPDITGARVQGFMEAGVTTSVSLGGRTVDLYDQLTPELRARVDNSRANRNSTFTANEIASIQPVVRNLPDLDLTNPAVIETTRSLLARTQGLSQSIVDDRLRVNLTNIGARIAAVNAGLITDINAPGQYRGIREGNVITRVTDGTRTIDIYNQLTPELRARVDENRRIAVDSRNAGNTPF